MALVQADGRSVAIIGAGPAGLMAAEVLAAHGCQVTVFDAMPSVGRKFLLAGKGGMNITHSEPLSAFVERYAEATDWVAPWLQDFSPQDLRNWVHGLGIETFVGSSGRVFPTEMKAAPLLRAWLQRLRARGVQFQMRTRWCGWRGQALALEKDGQIECSQFAAVLLATGGGSWPRLGSDGAWVAVLREQGVLVSPLRSANCGFDAAWSAHFAQRFAGQALPTLGIAWKDAQGILQRKVGACMLTATGIEGTLIYALSAIFREQIAATGRAQLWLDLLPDWPLTRVQQELQRPRGTRSWASHLQSKLGIKGAKNALLRELLPASAWQDAALVAQSVKALPLTLLATRPLAEAISSAGGVCRTELDQGLMLRALPGVFCAGEMLDWEAPTGGYLLTACFASGRQAAQGILNWLAREPEALG